jgi:hypothetical protein
VFSYFSARHYKRRPRDFFQGRCHDGPTMHKSRLAGFIIDCQTSDLPRAAAFWSAALGMDPAAEEGSYIALDGSRRDLAIEVQSVAHPSRVHLDIESDDVEAEVARLEALGARRVEQVKTWWVMEAPTGQRFCVIRAKTDLASRPGARVWDAP